MSSPPKIVLASKSAARSALLTGAGVAFEAIPSAVDEDAVKDALQAESASARDIADALAELKALRLSARLPETLVIGADQTLDCRGRLFDKPETRADAAAQLQELRGAEHTLHSAAVVALNGAPIWRHVGTARLTVRPFSDRFLQEYLDAVGDAVLSSVGAYHLEGRGAQLFSRVSGDYFTILGLPLLELLGFLRMRGALIE